MDCASTLLAACLAASPVAEPTARPVRSVALDAHRHFTDSAGDNSDPDALEPANKTFAAIDREMTDAGVRHAFLLSDAYLYGETAGPLRRALNGELSRFVTAHSGRFTGFCGVNLAWSDAAEETASCLRMPGMRGVKLHLRWLRQSLTEPARRASFERVLRAAEPFRAVFLIHMNFEVDEGAETRELLRAARRHPGATFIVAHAAEHHAYPLLALGRAALPNVYTEVSTFQIQEPGELVGKLRAFGLERVLFGVDGPGYGEKAAIRAFERLPLSEDEKDMILERNGAALLARLGSR